MSEHELAALRRLNRLIRTLVAAHRRAGMALALPCLIAARAAPAQTEIAKTPVAAAETGYLVGSEEQIPL